MIKKNKNLACRYIFDNSTCYTGGMYIYQQSWRWNFWAAVGLEGKGENCWCASSGNHSRILSLFVNVLFVSVFAKACQSDSSKQTVLFPGRATGSSFEFSLGLSVLTCCENDFLLCFRCCRAAFRCPHLRKKQRFDTTKFSETCGTLSGRGSTRFLQVHAGVHAWLVGF